MYMDDGSLSKSGELRIATNNFDYNDHVLFAGMLKTKYDIDIIIREQIVKYKNELRKYFTTATNAHNRDKFLRLIAPYIHSSMVYKVSSTLHNVVNSYRYNFNHLQYAAAKVFQVIELPKFSSRLYDIEVENDHNFMANGVLVHNCQKASGCWFAYMVLSMDEDATCGSIYFWWFSCRSSIDWRISNCRSRKVGWKAQET